MFFNRIRVYDPIPLESLIIHKIILIIRYPCHKTKSYYISKVLIRTLWGPLSRLVLDSAANWNYFKEVD